jgi:hypothetical protein
MLLGAAKLLAEEGGFDGILRFVFQPAEEWGQGALAMLDDGLMERFPFEEIYGLHNMPGLPVGHFQTRVGPIMSAEDNFEIVLKGVGGHAARPHWGNEVLVAACATVMNLQTIVSRRLSPTDIGVVSVTELIGSVALTLWDTNCSAFVQHRRYYILWLDTLMQQSRLGRAVSEEFHSLRLFFRPSELTGRFRTERSFRTGE